MRKIFLAFFLFFLLSKNHSQVFKTFWNTGTDSFIIFPGYGTNYKIVWEEFNNASNRDSLTGSDFTQINFNKRGNFIIKVNGGNPPLNRINFGRLNLKEASKLYKVENWDSIKWYNFDSAFMGCKNLYSLPDSAPDLSIVNSLNCAFKGCTNFNFDISNWNTSNIFSMSHMFEEARNFNKNIENWDVSKVKDMSYMFSDTYFNNPLNNWDVSQVVNMSYMFKNARYFNQPLHSWQTINVTTLKGMFFRNSIGSEFNQNINNWDVRKTKDFSMMFQGAYKYNKPLNNWQTDSMLEIEGMFRGAAAFNQPLSNWNLSKVANMSYLFLGATSFNQNINSWNVSNVKNMSALFGYADSFNQPLNNWNVSNVTNMYGLFGRAWSFNQNINNWNVSNVTNMQNMFAVTRDYNHPLNNWDVSNVSDMSIMFDRAYSFNQDLSSWNVSNVENMEYMFLWAQKFNQPLNNWNVSKVKNMGYMFFGAESFNKPLFKWNTINVQDMRQIFYSAKKFNQNIGNWNIENVSDSNGFPISFDSSGLDTNNYDSLLIGWAKQSTKSNLTISAKTLFYCKGASKRDSLILFKNWKFIGDSISLTCILPIKLTNFSATPYQSKVLLQWQTENETNNNYFTVQRSSNKDSWQDIITVKGNGNSSTTKKYLAYDNEPLFGVNYYRLKQTDFNVNFSYSDVKKIEIKNQKSEISLFPNPAKSVININCKEASSLALHNTLGQVVITTNLVNGTNKLNISNLPKGIYVAIISNKTSNTSTKIIVE